MPVAALSTYDWTKALTTVTSKTNGFPPFCRGINLNPSGYMPSCLTSLEVLKTKVKNLLLLCNFLDPGHNSLNF